MKSSLNLSGNALKIIAAMSMLIDHIGHILFPQVEILRIIGRLAFPIFAFMISEGCMHTKNKLRYLFTISTLALLCQIVYYLFDKSFDMCILVTFSLSILMIFALQSFKSVISSKSGSGISGMFAGSVFLLTVISVYLINQRLVIDYGFWGCMAPVAASLVGDNRADIYKRVLSLGVVLVIIAITLGGNQFYSLFAIPLLLLYSGKRGRWRMKYFFYIFYPVHLAVLQGVYMLREYL